MSNYFSVVLFPLQFAGLIKPLGGEKHPKCILKHLAQEHTTVTMIGVKCDLVTVLQRTNNVGQQVSHYPDNKR